MILMTVGDISFYDPAFKIALITSEGYSLPLHFFGSVVTVKVDVKNCRQRSDSAIFQIDEGGSCETVVRNCNSPLPLISGVLQRAITRPD